MRPRYFAALVGLESGEVHTFERLFHFRTLGEAVEWVLKMNAKETFDPPLTRWYLAEIPTEIEYVSGIPRWFTWLVHKWKLQGCKKVGHVKNLPIYRSCSNCGLVLDKEIQWVLQP